MNIRLYTDKDYTMIENWYLFHYGIKCVPEMFTEDSTFILENEEGKPWVLVCLYLTNCKQTCWIEGTISDPSLTKNRRAAVKELYTFVFNFAKDKGYKKIFAMAETKKTINLLTDCGYRITCNCITSFIKDLE